MNHYIITFNDAAQNLEVDADAFVLDRGGLVFWTVEETGQVKTVAVVNDIHWRYVMIDKREKSNEEDCCCCTG